LMGWLLKYVLQTGKVIGTIFYKFEQRFSDFEQN
jgi:hypothetical protein